MTGSRSPGHTGVARLARPPPLVHDRGWADPGPIATGSPERAAELPYPGEHTPGNGGGGGSVQHESTATGTDLEGRGYTLRDGDLGGWTWVDVVPVVCKQGVRVLVPLAPLVRDIIRTAGPGVQQQSTAAGIAGDAVHAFEPGSPPPSAVSGSGPGSGALSSKDTIVGIPHRSAWRPSGNVVKGLLRSSRGSDTGWSFADHRNLGQRVDLRRSRRRPRTRLYFASARPYRRDGPTPGSYLQR
jgi:hypothetical protein